MFPKHIFFKIKEYFNYLLEAKGIQSIHSPFLFELYKAIFKEEKEEDNKDFYTAEAYRNEFYSIEETITKTDFGAGPIVQKQEKNKILLADEVESSAVPPKVGQLLYKFIAFFKPAYILELGTNAGISTFYMILALRGRKDVKFFTIEGCKDLKQIAEHYIGQKAHFWADLPDVTFLDDSFEKSLPLVLNELPQLDFVVIDGDHRKEQLIRNFNLCASKASQNAVFILDDIRWSPEMLEAWEEIISNPKVTLSLDLFKLGIVFFNPSLSRQNFKIKW